MRNRKTSPGQEEKEKNTSYNKRVDRAIYWTLLLAIDISFSFTILLLLDSIYINNTQRCGKWMERGFVSGNRRDGPTREIVSFYKWIGMIGWATADAFDQNFFSSSDQRNDRFFSSSFISKSRQSSVGFDEILTTSNSHLLMTTNPNRVV